MTVMDDDTLIGRTLDDRYVILERIARGGMASVFRATDRRLDRVVAVKIMHPGNTSTSDTESVTREAQLAARLNHRGIVSVYDHGTDGDLTYIVMEYVPGRTLRDVLRDEAPMAPRRALAYLEPILIALSAAHEKGLIHRDVKPENVLISTNGDVKVADFGLARSATVEHQTSSVLIGTVSYLAPEVITHQGVDARADIYACGAMLFEMLTGTKPHTADSPLAVAHKHVNSDAPAPSSLVPDLPPYIDALTMRALARDRAQRSPDARTFLSQVRLVQRALADGLSDDPDLTRDLMPGAGPTPARPPRMRRISSDTEATGLIPVEFMGAEDPTSHVGEVEHTTAWAGSRARPEPTPAEPDGRAGRRGPLLLVLAVIALIATAIFGWYMGIGRYDATPNVINLPKGEAVKVTEAAGFVADFAPEGYSETVAKGSVIASDPAVGDRILSGDTVMLTISQGKERYEVPNIRGKTVPESAAILGSLNLQVGNTTREWHDSIPEKGVIRSSSHKVNQKVKRDTAVDLVVSKGPEPVDLVDHTGKKASGATSSLEAQGLKVATAQEFSDSVDKGVVISQTPRSGTGSRGDTIRLVVSKGPEMITVPSLKGMLKDEASDALKDLGLKIKTPWKPFGNGKRATVQYQSPSEGSKVKPGSSVTVFLS